MIDDPYTPIVVNTGGKLVVIDTGTGEANYERTKGAAGQFHDQSAAAGIDRNAVDTVIISHFHGDHMNGLLNADNKLGLSERRDPGAGGRVEVLDGRRRDEPRAGGAHEGLFKNNRARVRRARPQGHALRMGQGGRARHHRGGDAGPHAGPHLATSSRPATSKVYRAVRRDQRAVLFARHPDWHAFYDQDGAMAEATRRKVYDMLVAEKMLVQGFHYPFPALAYVEKTGDGYREMTVPWSPVI